MCKPSHGKTSPSESYNIQFWFGLALLNGIRFYFFHLFLHSVQQPIWTFFLFLTCHLFILNFIYSSQPQEPKLPSIFPMYCIPFTSFTGPSSSTQQSFLHLHPVLWALLFTHNCSSITLALHTFSTGCREGGFLNLSLICKKPNVLKIKTKMLIFIAASNFFRVSCNNQSPEQVV